MGDTCQTKILFLPVTIGGHLSLLLTVFLIGIFLPIIIKTYNEWKEKKGKEDE